MQRTMKWIFGVVLVLAQSDVWGAEPREVEMARMQFVRDIRPVSQRYINNLELIKRRYVQKNDHVSAEAVDQEVAAVNRFLEREGTVVEKKEELKSDSPSGRCFMFYPPNKKWLKVIYLRPDGMIVGSGNPNETGWEQRGVNLVFLDPKGQITGTYKQVRGKGDRLYYEHGSSGEVYVILEEARP